MNTLRAVALLAVFFFGPVRAEVESNALLKKTYSQSSQAFYNFDDGHTSTHFFVFRYDIAPGVNAGYVEIDSNNYDTSESHQISCSGLSYANVLTVDKHTGATRIAITTLDPSSPNCVANGVTSPYVIDLVAAVDPSFSETDNNVHTEYVPGSITKTTYLNQCWDEKFTGTFGPLSGIFQVGSNTSSQSCFVTVTSRTRSKTPVD